MIENNNKKEIYSSFYENIRFLSEIPKSSVKFASCFIQMFIFLLCLKWHLGCSFKF